MLLLPCVKVQNNNMFLFIIILDVSSLCRYILILYSCYRQLRFSLYSGGVITRTQFLSYNTFIDDSFLALDLSYALCLIASFLQHG